MDENDDLYFSFDEEDEEEAGDGDIIEAEESQNRGFLLGAIILGAVFVLGIAVIVIFLLTRQPPPPTVSDNELTNQAHMTLFAATQTADYQTQIAVAEQPPAEETPPPAEEEPGEPPPATPGVIEVTPLSAGEEEPEEAAPTEAAGTEVAEVSPPEEGATEAAPGEPTSAIIQVTPLGGDEGPGEAAGTIVAQPGTLPETGFAGGAGLMGAGLMALALIAVIAVARRLRLK